jgi:GxxExxY protein
MQFDELSTKVLGCAIAVHRELGPGLLESAYQRCLARELELAQLQVATEMPIALAYKGLWIPCAYRADLVVSNKLLVEIKCVDSFTPQHTAQILTYLKLTNLNVGLLLNFNLHTLRQGLRRFVRSH